MSYGITIRDTDGTARTYTVPAFGTFTVADWTRLCIPINDAEGRERIDEDLRRMVGIPKTAWRRLKEADRDKLIDAYVKLRTEADARLEEVASIDFANPTTITHEGIVYAVPKDIDNEVTTGQWADILTALDNATHEPEVYAALCGILLIPEGKEYEAPLTDIMERLPVRVAMGLSAFFFGTSERLRNEASRYLTRQVMSLLPERGPEEAASTNPIPAASI